MNTLVRSSAFVVVIALSAGALFAQDKTKEAPKPKKEETIVIRKKGAATEKITVVIDGDKVTVNGKPADDYKSDNVDIMRGDNFAPGSPRSFNMRTPMPPEGGWKMLNEDFMREIHSNKAFLGVMTKEAKDGAEITEVTNESAAEKAGLKEGDVITKINDEKITDADDLYAAVGKYKPNDKVTVKYIRNKEEKTAAAVLAENRQVRAFNWKNGDNDFDMDFDFDINPDVNVAPHIRGWNGEGDFWRGDKPRLGIQAQDTEDGKGAKVLDADEDEPAGKAGIKEDDIITSVNGKNITSVDGIKEIMKDVKKGDTVKITFLRDGKQQTVDIKFPKDLKTTDL